MNRLGLCKTSLLLVLALCVPFLNGSMSVQTNEELRVNTKDEYSSGVIPLTENQNLWYAWVSVKGTDLLYVARFSEVYNSPVLASFIGEHFNSSKGIETLMGNSFYMMEVYKDRNDNGIPDADYTSGVSEIEYFVLVNSSETFAPVPVIKRLINDTYHFTWAVTYGTVDAFFIDATNGTSGADVLIDHLTFAYDYCVEGNVSVLKVDFELGSITVSEVYGMNFSLDGLSFDLLYGTSIITAKPYSLVVNGENYNSTDTRNSATLMSASEVQIENESTFTFLFGANYTLTKGSVQEEHPSTCVAVATSSVSPEARSAYMISGFLSDMENFLRDFYSKTLDIAEELSLFYETSSFLYRICYPVWMGYPVKHDPTYIAHITPSEGPSSTIPIPFVFLGLVAAIGVGALIKAIYHYQKYFKNPGKSIISKLVSCNNYGKIVKVPKN